MKLTATTTSITAMIEAALAAMEKAQDATPELDSTETPDESTDAEDSVADEDEKSKEDTEMTYQVKHNYMMDNDIYEGLDIEQVKQKADEKASYTQQDIVIYDDEGNEIARRQWIGVSPEVDGVEEGADIIQFRDFGYFNEWQQKPKPGPGAKPGRKKEENMDIINGLTAKETFELMVDDWIADQDNAEEIEKISEAEYDNYSGKWSMTLKDNDGEFVVSDYGNNIVIATAL